jgi:hypothetical protein
VKRRQVCKNIVNLPLSVKYNINITTNNLDSYFNPISSTVATWRQWDQCKYHSKYDLGILYAE